MPDLNDFVFVDRVLIGMSGAPDLSAIEIETEAYFPIQAVEQHRRLGIIRVSMLGVQAAKINLMRLS